MSQTVEFTKDTAYPLEGTQYCFEGDSLVFACIKQGVTTITNDSNLTMAVYKGSTDVSSTTTTGSMSSSGNVAITKTMLNLVGGDRLHVTLQGTCDGVYMTFGAFWLVVKKKSGK